MHDFVRERGRKEVIMDKITQKNENINYKEYYLINVNNTFIDIKKTLYFILFYLRGQLHCKPIYSPIKVSLPVVSRLYMHAYSFIHTDVARSVEDRFSGE